MAIKNIVPAADVAELDRLEAEVLPRFTPDRVAAITELKPSDIERLPRCMALPSARLFASARE